MEEEPPFDTIFSHGYRPDLVQFALHSDLKGTHGAKEMHMKTENSL